MNIKLVVLASSVLLSTPALALHYKDGTEVPRKGPGYELVSESSHISPGSTGGTYVVSMSSSIEDDDKKSEPSFKKDIESLQQMNYICSMASWSSNNPDDVWACITDEIYSKVGQNVEIDSYHTLNIYNNTNNTVRYTVEIYLTTIQGDTAYNSSGYDIQPHGMLTISFYQFLTVNYKSPGQYINTAMTTLKSDNFNKQDVSVQIPGVAIVTS